MNKKIIKTSMITSLTLLFTACGGDATTSKYEEDKIEDKKPYQEIVGRVIDGYIKDSTVFFDLNRNQKPDSNEPQAKTDKYGRYTLKLNEEQSKLVDGQHSVIALGDGIDIDTGKKFTTLLSSNPSKNDSKNAVYLTPLSTFVGFTGKNAVFGELSGFAGIGNFKEKLTTLFGIDVVKNINFIRNNNLEYYKINNILQKIVEIDGITYDELSKRLEKDIDFNKFLDKSTNITTIKNVTKFYNSITQTNLKEKKKSIANAVRENIEHGSIDFDNINIDELKKDEFFNDVEDKAPIITISKPIKKEGTLYSNYNIEATIFLDRNRNLKLDDDEPRVKTDKNGKFIIEVEEQSISDRKSLVAINGKNNQGEISKDILFQTIMMNDDVYINAFTSFHTAAALAVTDTLTAGDIFHSNFTEGMLNSLDIDSNILKDSDVKDSDVETYKKSLKIKAIVRSIANTYDETKNIQENILDAYKYFSSSIVAPSDGYKDEFGFNNLVDRFNQKNPIQKDDMIFKSLIDKIVTKYDNASLEQLKSSSLKEDVEKLIEEAKKFRVKNKKAQTIEYNKLPKDQFSKYQWHLKDQGAIVNTHGIKTTGNGDLNVDELYKQNIVGENVHIRVVDDGVESSHEDLKARVDIENSWNATTKQNDPTSPSLDDTHGTQVAGLIAADGSNNIGVRGVAPYATLSGYKLRTPSAGSLDYSIDELTEAWLGGSDEISIVNNSWGSTIDKASESEEILEKGATTKRVINDEAKGRIYLIASGNGGFNQGDIEDAVDDSVTSYIRGSQYAITVAAIRNENIITQYSAQGSNVFVSGYGGGVKTHTAALLTTTTRTGQSKSTWKEDTKKAYTFGFDGTSAATPVTSGALALVMGECPNLSYRDVKWLIAKTAIKIDENYDGMTISGVKNVPPFKTIVDKNLYQGFGYIENAAGFSHSNYYGFGLINPLEMINQCKNGFTSLPDKKTIKVVNTNTSLTNLRDNNNKLEEKIRINKNEVKNKNKLDKIEWVGLTVYADIKDLTKLSMVLISPSGTKSRILTNSKTALNEIAKIEEGYRFSSVAFIGESPYGEWTLLAQTDDEKEEGRFIKMELEVVGHNNEERE